MTTSKIEIEPSVKNILSLIKEGKIKLNGNHTIERSKSYAFQNGKMLMLSTGGYSQRWIVIGELNF